jgi:hypothetical protein
VDWEGTAFRACIDDQAKLLGEFQEPFLHRQGKQGQTTITWRVRGRQLRDQEDEGSGGGELTCPTGPWGELAPGAVPAAHRGFYRSVHIREYRWQISLAFA